MKRTQIESRRRFLSDVGCGMLVASVGTAVASDLGVAQAAEQDDGRLTFGDLEPLVAMMQETPVNKLQPRLVEKLAEGTDLKMLAQVPHFSQRNPLFSRVGGAMFPLHLGFNS